jgi:hypothetical protein
MASSFMPYVPYGEPLKKIRGRTSEARRPAVEQVLGQSRDVQSGIVLASV